MCLILFFVKITCHKPKMSKIFILFLGLKKALKNIMVYTLAIKYLSINCIMSHFIYH